VRHGRALIAGAAAALVCSAPALGHADPTIHYLETQNLLASVGLPAAQEVELQLLGLVQEADRRGYPIKVSVIANETDTGGEAAPLANPQDYAELVSSELEVVAPLEAPVLIVTPRGFGLSGVQPGAGKVRRADAPKLLGGLPVPKADGNELARSAMLAVRKLASSGGEPLPAVVAPAQALAAPPRAAAAPADDGGVSTPLWVWSLVLASIPLVAYALYAIGTKRGD
jgi:hypothetical protein